MAPPPGDPSNRDKEFFAAESAKFRDRAAAAEEKFEHYFVALIFTTLGIGIQTAKWAAGSWSDMLQFGAFATFFVSGALSIVRLEWKTRLHHLEANSMGWINFDASGRTTIDTHNKGRREAEAAEKKMMNRLKRSYRWQRTLFLMGCFLLLLSRAPLKEWYFMLR